MKVKRIKSHKRPSWNPTVEITFRATLCMAEAINRAVDETGLFLTSNDFLREAVSKRLKEVGIRHKINEPRRLSP